MKSKSTTDAPDGLPATRRKNNSSPGTSRDPVVEAHGDYFFVNDDGRVTMNQVAVAAKFAEDRHVYYDYDSACFRQYDAKHGHYAEIQVRLIKWQLAEFLKLLAEKCDAESFIAKRTNALFEGLLHLLRGYDGDVDQEFESRKPFHVGNGMLEIGMNEVKLHPFDTRYRSKQYRPINYNAGAKCPRFLNELLRPAVGAEDVDLLQRWFGAQVFGENRAQRFLVIHGIGGSGKSTFVNIVEEVIGVENTALLRTSHLGGRFETHAFLNKTLLVAKDVGGDFLTTNGAQMIKSLTGNDRQEAEQKFGGKKKFTGIFNLVVTSNARLQMRLEDDLNAWRRRMLTVEFKRETPARIIPNLARLLIEEQGEGILAWVVEGAKKHLRELEQVGDYVLTSGQQERIESLLNESRSAEYFVEHGLEFFVKGDLSVEEILQAYFEYCERQNWRPLTPRQFENELGDLMLKFHSSQKRTDIRRHGSFVRGFKNIALVAANSSPQ